MKAKKSTADRKSIQKNKKPYSSNKTKKAKISNRDLTDLIDSQQVQILNLDKETVVKKGRIPEKTREEKIQVLRT